MHAVSSSPDDTQRCAPPVVELDPCELTALEGGLLVTDEDYGAVGRARPLPPRSSAFLEPGVGR